MENRSHKSEMVIPDDRTLSIRAFIVVFCPMMNVTIGAMLKMIRKMAICFIADLLDPDRDNPGRVFVSMVGFYRPNFFINN